MSLGGKGLSYPAAKEFHLQDAVASSIVVMQQI
jgi:hypothetical protein